MNIFNPTVTQRLFLKANTRYVAIGGGRAGGGTHALRMKALKLISSYPGIIIMMLTHDLMCLQDCFIRPISDMLKGCSTYSDSEQCLTFMNGSRIFFDFCYKKELDIYDAEFDRYYTKHANVIFIDNAESFSHQNLSAFCSCIHGQDGFPCRVYLSAHPVPGSTGAKWVKAQFIDADDPDYTFVPITYKSNPYLTPELITIMEKLPDAKIICDGDWSVVD